MILSLASHAVAVGTIYRLSAGIHFVHHSPSLEDDSSLHRGLSFPLLSQGAGGLNPLLGMAEQMTVSAACIVQAVAWDRLISPLGHVSRSNPPRIVQGMDGTKLDKLSVWNRLGDCHPEASRSLSGAQISLETRNRSRFKG